MKKTIRKEYSLICDPNSIVIKAKESLRTQRLEVVLHVNEKEALYGSYSLYSHTEEEALDKIRTFCNAIMMFTEDEIQDWVQEEKIMASLYTHRFLEKVWTRSGKKIWEKP